MTDVENIMIFGEKVHPSIATVKDIVSYDVKDAWDEYYDLYKNSLLSRFFNIYLNLFSNFILF